MWVRVTALEHDIIAECLTDSSPCVKIFSRKAEHTMTNKTSKTSTTNTTTSTLPTYREVTIAGETYWVLSDIISPTKNRTPRKEKVVVDGTCE